MRVGKKVIKSNWQSETPGRYQLPGVSLCWLSSVVSIQPFADVVGNYTCCDGDQKGHKVLQLDHLLHCEGVDSMDILQHFSTPHKGGVWSQSQGWADAQMLSK